MSAVFSKRSAELAKKNFVDAAVKTASTNKKSKSKLSIFDRHAKKSNSAKKKSAFEIKSATQPKVISAVEETAQLNKRLLQDLSNGEMERRRKAYVQLVQDVYADSDLPLANTVDEDNNWVIGRGQLNAQLLIIGEAPGAQEAKAGEPFVGPSGERLEQELNRHGIRSNKHAFVSNLVFVRPAHNRDPSWEEIVAYLPYLRRLVNIVKPKLILCLGRLCSAVFLRGIGSIDMLKDEPYVDGQHRFKGENMDVLYRNTGNSASTVFFEERFVCRVYATYHPSAILRSENPNPHTPPNPKFAERWSEDFSHILDLVDQTPLKFIDAEEIITETTDPGFIFTNPDQVCYRNRRHFSDAEAIAYAQTEGLEMEVHRCDYEGRGNFFKIVGRTADDVSVCLLVRQPTFSFYVSYRSIKDGSIGENELNQLEQDVNNSLLESMSELQRLAQFNSGQWTNGPLVQLSIEPNKLKYVDISAPKNMLRVKLSNDNHKYAVARILDAYIGNRFRDFRPPKEHNRILPKDCKWVKTFERNYKPIQQLMLDKNIYIRGWIKIAPPKESSLRVRLPGTEAGRISSADLEYDVNYNDLVGYSPNPGESGNERWERQAPTRVLALDAEMLAVGGHFPRSEQDPVISIAAYGHTADRANKKNYTEKIRGAAAGKTYEPRSTGRSNYDDAAVFCVGSLAALHTSDFKPEYLPNIPPVPKPMDLGWNEGGRKPDGGYHLQYAIGIRSWNAFIESYQIWHELVGAKRAFRIVRNNTLYKLLQGLQVRPGGKDIKSEWKDEAQLLKWESDVARIASTFETCVSKKDVANLTGIPEPNSLNTDDEAELEHALGTIQMRWRLFRPASSVYSFSNEKDMFRGFYNYVQSYDPDMITGYNSNNFDLSYFINRVRVLNLLRPDNSGLISMGRYPSHPDEVETKHATTAATGDRTYQVPHISGRDSHDLLNYVMRDMKLNDYRLASVAQYCLKDTKNDVPYSAIPSLFRTNRERLNRYCGKDAELVIMLINDMNNMNYLIALARLIGLMHIERLYVDGKQEQVFSVLIRFLREEGFGKVMPDRNKYSHEDDSVPVEAFTGAHVFDPKTKGLYEKLLLCLDYNSLYPSIMQARNLGHDKAGTARRMLKYGYKLEDCFKTMRTFINPKTALPEEYYFYQPPRLTKDQVLELGLEPGKDSIKPLAELGKKEFWVFEESKRNEDGTITKRRFRCTEKELVEKRTDLKKENAVHHSPRVRHKHILKKDVASICSALTKMLAARKRVNIKKELFHPSSDEFRRLNQIQMTLKIVCNSTYGATGVVVGKLSGQHISATVTGVGKETILNLASKMESEYEGDVQGGDTDSIFVHFPSIDKLSKIYEKIDVTDPVTGEIRRMTRIGQILEYANSLVPPPMKIDFEKAFEKIFAFAKKRAVTLTQTPIWDPLRMEMVFRDAKLDYKGVEMKRRDSCPAAQKTLTGFATKLFLGQGDRQEREISAVEFVRKEVDNILNGNVPFHELIQTRQLAKKHYATPVPHMVLNEKMRRRGYRTRELGERISFIVVTGRSERSFAQSAEDPDFALEHNLLPDYEYVVEKKIQKPIERFTKFMENGDEYNRRMFMGRRKRQKHNLLDDDPILRIVRRAVPCMVCKKPGPNPVCEPCRPLANWQAMLNAERADLEKEEGDLEQALKTCRACTGVNPGETIDCDNGTCKSYFPRRAGEFKVIRRKERMQTLVDHMDLW